MQLQVVGLTSHEFETAMDADPEPIRAVDHILAACVYQNGRPAFGGVGSVRALSERELQRLAVVVTEALSRVCPIMSRCDYMAWLKALEQGAGDPSNAFTAHAIADCVDYAIGASQARVTLRPDRYFGLPLRSLTDGQLLAFRAAVNVAQKQREND